MTNELYISKIRTLVGSGDSSKKLIYMGKEICTIFIGNGILDDDYTFYADGRIKRVNDQSAYSLNVESWVTPSDISLEKKKKLQEKCDPMHMERIKKILA